MSFQEKLTGHEAFSSNHFSRAFCTYGFMVTGVAPLSTDDGTLKFTECRSCKETNVVCEHLKQRKVQSPATFFLMKNKKTEMW